MIRRFFRWLFRLLILAIVLAVAAVLLKDTLAKAAFEWQVRRQTGLSPTIRKLEIGLTTPTVTMEGFKLFNPAEYGGSLLCDLAEAQAEYEPAGLAGRRVHLRVLRLNLRELNLVRNKAGQTNLLLLLDSPAAGGGGRKPSRFEFSGIDRLYLSVGTVRFVDLLQPRKNWQMDLRGKNYEMDHVRTISDIHNMILRLALEGRMAEYQQAERGPATPGPEAAGRGGTSARSGN